MKFCYFIVDFLIDLSNYEWGFLISLELLFSGASLPLDLLTFVLKDQAP